MTCRNSLDGVETRGRVVAPGTSSGGALETGPSGTRLGGGVSPDQALLWNAGTCRPEAKGEARAGGPCKSPSTDAGHRGGAARSRAEDKPKGARLWLARILSTEPGLFAHWPLLHGKRLDTGSRMS